MNNIEHKVFENLIDTDDESDIEVFVDRSEDFQKKVSPKQDEKEKPILISDIKGYDLDEEFLNNKLKGYTRVHHSRLHINDHARLTKNKYREDGRKCVYIIVKKKLPCGGFMVNGYKSKWNDWKINPKCKWKEYRFYKKF